MSKGYYRTGPDAWVVQASMTAPGGSRLRSTKRVQGKESAAKQARKEMLAELEEKIRAIQVEHAMTTKRKAAAETLGLDLDIQHGASTRQARPGASRQLPTLRDFLTGRWADHAHVVQNATTRRTTATHVSYLSYYAGDLRLDEIDAGAFARIRENLLRDGPRCFRLNQAGGPRRPRTDKFTATAVNRITGTLLAALRLAERERLIDRAPDVDMLPIDRSEPIDPPTDAELQAILAACPTFAGVAPFMAEAIKLAAWTGLRAGEQFTLPWGSVDLNLGKTGAIKIEKQHRVRMVDGKAWSPKCNKARQIPLSNDVRELLLNLRERVPHGPDDPVIPSRGGSPYVRLEAAPDCAGKGYFPDVVEASGVGRRIRWHDLRHAFAVKALLSGVQMAVVSRWLGHSGIQLTVDTYGRWGEGTPEQWDMIERMSTSRGPGKVGNTGPVAGDVL